MEVPMHASFTHDLASIEKNCWHCLAYGALHAADAMHTAVVANANNPGLNMRTVVLRNATPAEKQLTFFTDTRSGKWVALQQQNYVNWLFYDAGARLQIKAGGQAFLYTKGETADNAWAATTPNNRKNYLTEQIPSSIIAGPEGAWAANRGTTELTLKQSEAGRKNFGIVITNIDWMEWLWLNHDGHRRANFIYGEEGKIIANWLAP